MENSNQPAFPIFLQEGLSNNSHVDSGISKREYFAAMAMQGLIASESDRKPENYAADAVSCADALCEALDKTINGSNK